MKRSKVRPLDDPSQIYTILAHLPLYACVPPQVRIYDYNDGTIPSWRLQERESGELVQVLTLIDESTIEYLNLFEVKSAVGVEVFTSKDKTLAAPAYKYIPGGVKRRDQLSDIRQHARQWNDKNSTEEEEDDEIEAAS